MLDGVADDEARVFTEGGNAGEVPIGFRGRHRVSEGQFQGGLDQRGIDG